ncbi:MAG: hypothetical protein R2724_20975 [Bryobacterales bacterium]
MRLASAALLLLAAPLAAQEHSLEARRLVLDASRALQADAPARFLGYFDKRATPHFGELRQNLLALLATKTVASSVQIDKTTVEGGEASLSVDWLLQLTPIDGIGAVEQRHEVVQVRVRLGEKPMIVSLTPIELFRPAQN